MSHQPERKEKNCLNCGAIVQGPYCHICGQENVVPHQNFWSLSKHFIYDIFHFDGKFFDTVKYMLLRPGLLPKEYIAGKRVKYLDPIRMYLFTSAVFFLIFSTISSKEISGATSEENLLLSRSERFEVAARLQAAKDSTTSDAISRRLHILLDTNYLIKGVPVTKGKEAVDTFWKAELDGKEYVLQPIYDTILSKATTELPDNWLTRLITNRKNKFLSKNKDNIREGLISTAESFLHKLPYFLFISLPFFALILKLLYIRRKSFFYSDHAVFTLYHYIFSFILLLFVFVFNALNHWLHWGIFAVLIPWLFVVWAVYLYVEMKNFYGQGWLKTLGKFLLLNLMAFLIISILFVIFLFITTI